MQHVYRDEYRRIRGRAYELPPYRSLFHGHVPPAAARWIVPQTERSKTA